MPTTKTEHVGNSGGNSGLNSATHAQHYKWSDPELIFDFNVSDVSDELDKVVHSMHLTPDKAIRNLRSIMTRLSDSVMLKHWMTRWHDKRGLDLLQCAIVVNKPTIVRFMLEDAHLFPPTYFPKLNPYAHVAAIIGFKECLDAVLQTRPKDYFAATDATHLVKLPPDIVKTLKLSQIMGMADRKLDKIVRSVKGENTHAENASLESLIELKMRFEQEVKDFEDSFKEETKEPPRKRFQYPKAATQNPKIKFADIGPQPPVQRHTMTNAPSPTSLGVKQGRSCVRIPRPGKVKESKVTVHMDIFKNGCFNIPDNISTTDSISKNDGKVRFLPEINKPRMRTGTIRERMSTASFRPSSSKRSFKSISKERSAMSSLASVLNKPEIGLPRFKKYKEFVPVLDPKSSMEDPTKYMDKSPLTLAAERNHYDCVRYLLEKFHVRKGSKTGQSDSLTLAAKARVPEAIAILLQTNISVADYQNAVMLSIREIYPDSLNILLTVGDRLRRHAFGEVNLFHSLYSHSLQTNYRYEMLPEMTRILINSKENVNSHVYPSTYPIYTLIQSAFNVALGETSMYYLKCLKMLLAAKANPNYDEFKHYQKAGTVQTGVGISIDRPTYSSAIQCVLVNANLSFEHFAVSYWSQVIMQKFIEAIETEDRNPHTIQHDLLFLYMKYVRKLGLNRRVLRALLRYGANPDYKIDGKYALNMYFEEMIPFLTRFKVVKKMHTSTDNVLKSLLFLCKAMSAPCLHASVLHFLDHHLLSTPLQALEITRKFCYHVNKMIVSPRSLTHISSLFVWVTCKRNPQTVRQLPIPEEIIQVIIP